MFKIHTLLMILFSFSLVAGEYEEHLKKEGGDERFIQTVEDKKRLGTFAGLYEMAKMREAPTGVIPKTLHFIWLGPKPFPKESVSNVKGWIDKHPGWKVKFWTDLGTQAPDDRMEVTVFDAFPLQDLKEYYFRSDNFGERSEILRYAVLFNEGGVYIDHDMQCLKSLDTLQQTHDFFCGLEPLGTSVLSSSINPSPHLLASTAQHPIFAATKKWLIDEWDHLEAQYPGTDPLSVFNRVKHRTFRALFVGFKEAHCRAGRKDVVFPPDYFSLKGSKNALFATHHQSGSWYTKKSDAELKIQALLADVLAGTEKTFLLALGLVVINVAMGIFFLFKIRRIKQKRNP